MPEPAEPPEQEPADETAADPDRRALPVDPAGMWLVRASGELDLDTVGALHEELTWAAARYPVVILDLSRVDFGDSSFLNLLIRLRTTTRLRLVAPTEPLRQLFALTGTDAVLDVYETIAEAIDAG
jgi:anti-anti-sigma factor